MLVKVALGYLLLSGHNPINTLAHKQSRHLEERTTLPKGTVVELLVLYHHIIIFLLLVVALLFFCCRFPSAGCFALLALVLLDFFFFLLCLGLPWLVSLFFFHYHCAINFCLRIFFSSSTFLLLHPINTNNLLAGWASSCGATAI